MASVQFTTKINVKSAQVSPTLAFAIPPVVSVARNGTADLAQYVTGGTPPYGTYAVDTGTLASGVTIAAGSGLLSASGSATIGDKTGLRFRVKDAALTTVASPTVTVKVYDASAAYPAKGVAKMVDPAHGSDSVMPSYHNATSWGYSLFGSQGSGVFNPYYSEKGAYVLAGPGGHEHSSLFGAAVFDFTSMQWSYLECANTGAPRSDSPVWLAETNGEPYVELLAAPGVPAPPHPYRTNVLIPPAKGGGPLGSMMWLGRGGTLGWPISIGSIHKFNLSTRMWSRVTDDLVYRNVEGTALYDPVTNRYYSLPSAPQYVTKELYLDGNDWTVKSTASYSKRLIEGGSQAWIQEGGGVRAIMAQVKTRLFGFNLDAPSSGWTELTVAGEPIAFHFATFVLHEAQNVLYRRLSEQTGQGLYRLTPPAGNPLAGTWTHDTVTIAGDVIAHYVPTQYTGSIRLFMPHYRSLMYIPALQMLGWVTPNGVFLLNP